MVPEQLDSVQQRGRSILPLLLSVNVHLVLLVIFALILLKPEPEPERLVLELGKATAQEELVFDTFSIDDSRVSEPSATSIDVPSPVPVDRFIGVADPVFDSLGSLMSSGDGMATLSFDERIRDARKFGIDLVIVFDATSSMANEIRIVKRHIAEISQVVLDKIPEAKFSVVVYRDYKDRVPVSGIPLGNDMERLSKFISAIKPEGGGSDLPEAVLLGMEWGTSKNQFRPRSQRVMLVLGDAPPHAEIVSACATIARKFGRSRKGIVHTITCRSKTPLTEFQRISYSGGGRAYTMVDTTRLLEELLILAFGHQHREEIIEMFNLNFESELDRIRHVRSIDRSPHR